MKNKELLLVGAGIAALALFMKKGEIPKANIAGGQAGVGDSPSGSGQAFGIGGGVYTDMSQGFSDKLKEMTEEQRRYIDELLKRTGEELRNKDINVKASGLPAGQGITTRTGETISTGGSLSTMTQAAKDALIGGQNIVTSKSSPNLNAGSNSIKSGLADGSISPTQNASMYKAALKGTYGSAAQAAAKAVNVKK